MRVNCLACNHSFELSGEQLQQAALEAADPISGAGNGPANAAAGNGEPPEPKYTADELAELEAGEFSEYASAFGIGLPAADVSPEVRRHVIGLLGPRGGVREAAHGNGAGSSDEHAGDGPGGSPPPTG